MTEVKIFFADNDPKGFEISGHSSSNCNDEVGKTVCAAVSSAAYIVTEIIGDKLSAEVEDGFMSVTSNYLSKSSVYVLKGFVLHIKELSEQYPDKIRIISEV